MGAGWINECDALPFLGRSLSIEGGGGESKESRIQITDRLSRFSFAPFHSSSTLSHCLSLDVPIVLRTGTGRLIVEC